MTLLPVNTGLSVDPDMIDTDRSIPLLRQLIRFSAPSAWRQELWESVVDPHFAWLDHSFVADTIAGIISGNTRDILQQYLYYFGVWEPRVTALIQSRLGPGDGFVDIGANIGYFSLLAARAVGATGAVVSIEASPRTAAMLRENVARNQARARVLNVAASDRRGTLSLFSGGDYNCGASTLAPGVGDLETRVEADRIDDLLTSAEKAKTRLVKIDVEGAEAAVIAGMSSLLTEAVDVREFLVEIHPDLLARLGYSVDDVLRPFADAGYRAYRVENDYDAGNYLWPVEPTPLPRLKGSVDADVNVLFSRTDEEQL